MPMHLISSGADFEGAFRVFLASKREASEDVEAVVRDIIADVRSRGDAALIELTRRFDRTDVSGGMRVGAAELDAALAATDAETRAALELARSRIAVHHQRQLPQDERYTDATGARLGWRWTAIESVGVYVPGGSASFDWVEALQGGDTGDAATYLRRRSAGSQARSATRSSASCRLAEMTARSSASKASSFSSGIAGRPLAAACRQLRPKCRRSPP